MVLSDLSATLRFMNSGHRPIMFRRAQKNITSRSSICARAYALQTTTCIPPQDSSDPIDYCLMQVIAGGSALPSRVVFIGLTVALDVTANNTIFLMQTVLFVEPALARLIDYNE